MRLVGFISARIARGFTSQPMIVRRMPMIRTINFFAFMWDRMWMSSCADFEEVCAQGGGRKYDLRRAPELGIPYWNHCRTSYLSRPWPLRPTFPICNFVTTHIVYAGVIIAPLFALWRVVWWAIMTR